MPCSARVVGPGSTAELQAKIELRQTSVTDSGGHGRRLRLQGIAHCFFWLRFSLFAARFSMRLFAGFFLVSILAIVTKPRLGAWSRRPSGPEGEVCLARCEWHRCRAAYVQ